MEDVNKIVSDLIKPTRAEILNILEIVVPPDKWLYIRSRVLKALGQNGLEGKIIRIIESENYGE